MYFAPLSFSDCKNYLRYDWVGMRMFPGNSSPGIFEQGYSKDHECIMNSSTQVDL